MKERHVRKDAFIIVARVAAKKSNDEETTESQQAAGTFVQTTRLIWSHAVQEEKASAYIYY